MNVKTIAAVGILMLPTSLWAANSAGRTAVSFLLENPSARQSGMGGAFAASAEGSEALHSNPAAAGWLYRPEVSLSYASAQNEGGNGFVGGAAPVFRKGGFALGVGAGVQYFNAGNVDITPTGGPTRSFSAENDYAGSAVLAARIGRWISVGVAPKYVRSTLVEQYTGSAYAADAGVMISPFPALLKNRVTVGAAIQNMGAKITYKTLEHDLPRTDSLAIALRPVDRGLFGSLSVTLQTEKTLNEVWRYRMGMEGTLGSPETERAFFFRGGYSPQYNNQDYALGAGFRERSIQVDYAFISAVELENLHRITLTYRFGSYADAKDTFDAEFLEQEKKLKEGHKREFMRAPGDRDSEVVPGTKLEKPEKHELLKNERTSETQEILEPGHWNREEFKHLHMKDSDKKGNLQKEYEQKD